MSDPDLTNRAFRRRRLGDLAASLLGGLGGAVFYFLIPFLLLPALWGPKGRLVPREPDEVYKSGYYVGRVLGDPINLGSYVAFGAAVAMLFARRLRLWGQERGFRLDVLGADEQALLLPDDALDGRKRLNQCDDGLRMLVVPQLLHAGLQRARANWSAEDVGAAIKTQAELFATRSEAEYALIRYLAWAIPSIGFIGTVLGISQAMGAFRGKAGPDLDLATASLATAFDTTFVALVLSLILMYLLYRTQAADDDFLARAVSWCMRRLVYRMHIPQGTQA